MFVFSPYISFIIIIIIVIIIIITMYCIRLNRAHRQVLPYPMKVFVISQPDQYQLHDSRMFWSSSIEQLPPPYSAVIQSTATNCTIAHENNES
jgi:hypothetical protein